VQLHIKGDVLDNPGLARLRLLSRLEVLTVYLSVRSWQRLPEGVARLPDSLRALRVWCRPGSDPPASWGTIDSALGPLPRDLERLELRGVSLSSQERDQLLRPGLDVRERW